jgi:hypothetical protein
MPTFDFLHWRQDLGPTLAASGPVIPVEVSMPKPLEEFCTKKGIPIPAPQAGYALIDTGASISAIDESILQRLSLLPIDSIPSVTAAGNARSFIYPTNVSFPALGVKDYRLSRVIGCNLKWKTKDDKEIIMLLGRDILQFMLFIYNGPLSNITIAF